MTGSPEEIPGPRALDDGHVQIDAGNSQPGDQRTGHRRAGMSRRGTRLDDLLSLDLLPEWRLQVSAGGEGQDSCADQNENHSDRRVKFLGLQAAVTRLAA